MARNVKKTGSEEAVVKTTTRRRKPVEKPAEEIMPAVEEKAQEETVVIQPEKPDQKDVEIDNLKTQIEQLKQLIAAQQAQPQQIVVQTADNSERVWFLWLADVAPENQILIGENGQYGRIVGSTGTFYVPKNDLSRVLDSAVRHYLEKRWMIVISGLTEEEREALGVNYHDGELLDEKAFRNIANMGSELLEIFPALCDSHKEMVASRYHETYMSGKPVDRNMVVALNKIYPSVAFKDILEDMNAKEANG